DVEAAADVHVLQPVGDGQVPVRVEVADVAGVQPAVGADRGAGRLLVAVVAEHQVRPAEQDLAGSRDLYLETGRGPSRGAGPGPRVVARAAHGGHHGFG